MSWKMNKNTETTQNIAGANHTDSDMPRRKILTGSAAFIATAATRPVATFAAETTSASPGNNQNNKKGK